jgi:hypothetical protein
MAVAYPFDLTGDLVLFKERFCEMGKMLEVFIDVFGIMVGDKPQGDLGLFDEGGGIADGGVPPACFFEVLVGKVLGFVNKEVGSFEKIDEALVGFEKGWRNFRERAVITLKHFIVGGVTDGLAGRFDFKAIGEARMMGGMEIKGQGTDLDGGFWVDGPKFDLSLYFIEADWKKFGRHEVVE